jgi:phospholipase C
MGESPAMVGARPRKAAYFAAIAAAVVGAGVAVGTAQVGANAAPRTLNPAASAADALYLTPGTATPIKHLVVIFDENVSFDHYFGTYPFAANTDGSTFRAGPGTTAVNGLYAKITSSGPTGPLLTSNPNLNNPVRLTHGQALTCDQDHGYTDEQKAVDGGKMDKFVQFTDVSSCSAPNFGAPGLVMDYYDGNTVTGLWNYAQHYAMSDNNWDTTFGPSTPGALNLISGQTGASYAIDPTTGVKVQNDVGAVSPLDSNGLGTVYGDPDPAYDDCSDASHTKTSPLAVATGTNVGDLLNAKGITWGWFQGGFAPTGTNSAGFAVCGAASKNIGGASITDYSPHHEPFQYYKSTANPKHLPPSNEAAIGHTDQASHQYDLSDFYTTLKDGNMPAVSYLKASEYQDGHPGYSDPLDEQNFLVGTVNKIEKSRFWPSTAIVITYDDSDGWYDHQRPVIVNGSSTSLDASICTSAPVVLGTTPDRCGFSQRLPMVVISPWTRQNYVSHQLTNTVSTLRFIEDNWLSGKRIGSGSYDAISGGLGGWSLGGLLDFFTRPHLRPVILDPGTGQVVSG